MKKQLLLGLLLAATSFQAQASMKTVSSIILAETFSLATHLSDEYTNLPLRIFLPVHLGISTTCFILIRWRNQQAPRFFPEHIGPHWSDEGLGENEFGHHAPGPVGPHLSDEGLGLD